jgi:CheY-like chemotaxis protein
MLDLTGKNILVVEDEDMNFIYLRQIFKLTNGEITRVKTGKSAIEPVWKVVSILF